MLFNPARRQARMMAIHSSRAERAHIAAYAIASAFETVIIISELHRHSVCRNITFCDSGKSGTPGLWRNK
jgi:hypothetical protein